MGSCPAATGVTESAAAQLRHGHTEYRDDRFVAAAALGAPMDLFYLVRAVTPGRYVVPATFAEDMYRPEVRGIGKAEADITAQAIGRYRAKASEYARQFGYGSYVLGDVSISSDEASPQRPLMMKAMRAGMSADESLPTETGKATVTVNVSGSVLLAK